MNALRIALTSRILPLSATKARRRMLACAFVAALVLQLSVWFTSAPRGSAVPVLCLDAVWGALGLVLGIRYLVDTSGDASGLLLRKHALATAYLIVICGFFLGAVTAGACDVYSAIVLDQAASPSLSYGQVEKILTTAFVLVLALPAVVFAWIDPT